MNEERRKAARNLAAGGMLLGMSEGGNALLERDFDRHGRPGVLAAAADKRIRPVRVRRAAGKLGVWAARSTAIPLAAYGAAKLVKPGSGVKDVHVGRDVVRPVVRTATLQTATNKRAMAKRDLSNKDQQSLINHKEIGRKLSLASGSMGLAALALRAPQGAGVAVRRIKGAGRVKPLVRLAGQNERATRASNTLGILAIGTGSVGSFNYAAQQRLERQQQELRNPGGIKKNQMALFDEEPFRKPGPLGHVVVQYPTGRRFKAPVTGPSDGTSTEVYDARSKARVRVADKLIRARFRKADDRFLRKYRQNISTDAERGYQYLRTGRNRAIASSAVSTGVTGLNTYGLATALRGRRPGWAAIHAGLGAVSGANAVQSGRKARSWNAKMGKIKAKAYQRAAVGELGRDRVGKRDKRSEYAEAGTGAALLTAGVKGNKIFDAARDKATAVVDARHRQMIAPHRALLPIDEMGRPVKGANSPGRSYFATRPNPDKAGLKARRKAAAGAVRQANELRNTRVRAISRAAGFRPRAAMMSAAMMGGTGLLWHGARTGVEKKLDRHDVDAGVAGALVGTAGYHGALYATKPIDRRIERQFAQEPPSTKAILAQHKRASGITGSEPKGDTRWLKYHRTYPKSLPGWRWKRTMSYLQGGRAGVVASGVAGGLTAAGAIAANRRKEAASKALFRMPRTSFRVRTPRPRVGGIRRNAYGTISTFRGSIPGTIGR